MLAAPQRATDVRSNHVRPDQTWWLPLLWASVIFATSCRFIARGDFIRFVARFLPAGATQQTWSSVWLLGGLFFVKGYHAAEFALLFALVHAAMGKLRPDTGGRTVLMSSAGVCVLYAILDEWHQTFVPGRGGTARDVAVDCVGVSLAAFYTTLSRGGKAATR